MRLALVLLVAIVGLFACACERVAVPPLVEVTEIAPRIVEGGDRLDIRGSGFPQGRPARVSFEGTLYRAGEPDASVSIDAEANVAATDRVELVVREPLEERFCGRADRAAHATFVGTVEVAFASRTPGAPPLVGALRGVTLDVRPSSVRAAVLEARAAEGSRVLAFLGMKTSTPSAGGGRGLPIDEVAHGSIAEQAGIRAGDFLAVVDGVHALGVEDVLPSSARSARLGIRHADDDVEETKTVPMTGYAGRRIPRELEPALVLVALALAALLLLVVPGPAVLTRVELGLASRLRARSLAALLLRAVGDRAEACTSVLASAAVATLALAPHVLAADVDGIVLLVAAVSTLLASRADGARGALATLHVVVDLVACMAAVVAAMAMVAAASGALELSDVVRAQGGAPWQFAAARDPATLVVSCAYLCAVVAVLRVEGGGRTTRARVFERLGVLAASALAAAVFFGGWQLPAVDEPRTAALRALAAVVFLAKTWMLAAALLGAASLAPAWRAAAARAFAAKKLAPALAVAAILAVLVRRLSPGVAVENAFGAAAFTAVALVVVRSTSRVRSALARREPHASPFL